MQAIKKIIKKTPLYEPLRDVLFYWSALKMKRNVGRAEIDGYVQLPKGVVFEPTTKCNLSCQMCYQKVERALGKKDMTLNEIKSIFAKLKNDFKIESTGLIGAEIFMRPDIFDFIGYLGKQNTKVYLATNGTLLSESSVGKLKKLKNITGIGYSLDGTKEYHNKIRGVQYAFDRLMNAVKMTKDHFSLTLNSVVMADNASQLESVAELVKNIGVPNYSLQFEMFSTPEEVEEAARILGLNSEDFAVEIKESDKYDFKIEDIKKSIETIKKMGNLHFLIQPSAYTKFPEDYFDGTLREKKKLYCKDMNTLRINAQGNVIFCPFIKKEFGSLLSQKPEDIWNGEEMRTFRKKLLQSNLTPVCKRCCRLDIR